MSIDPESPWQNAWIESFNGRLSDELLNMWQFDSLLEAQVLAEGHRIDYMNPRGRVTVKMGPSPRGSCPVETVIPYRRDRGRASRSG